MQIKLRIHTSRYYQQEGFHFDEQKNFILFLFSYLPQKKKYIHSYIFQANEFPSNPYLQSKNHTQLALNKHRTHKHIADYYQGSRAMLWHMTAKIVQNNVHQRLCFTA